MKGLVRVDEAFFFPNATGRKFPPIRHSLSTLWTTQLDLDRVSLLSQLIGLCPGKVTGRLFRIYLVDKCIQFAAGRRQVVWVQVV